MESVSERNVVEREREVERTAMIRSSMQCGRALVGVVTGTFIRKLRLCCMGQSHAILGLA